MTDISKGSPERFGYSRNHFSSLTEEQEKQFCQWTAPIRMEEWKNQRFLDAGCGAGRNSVWPMSYGAVSGVAIDVDGRSLDRARENLKNLPVEVRHCSIYEIPFENEFDIAFSIGVVHHLEFPDLAIEQITKSVKPGGRILVWVYGYENLEFYVNILSPIRKFIFSRAPLPLVQLCAHVPASVLWIMLRLGFQPIAYLKMLRSFPYRHLHHIIFDQMLPKTAKYWRKGEAISLLERAGLKDVIAVWVNECSWAVLGRKDLGR